MLQLKVTLRYCIAFYCITMLYASLHELVHHLAGYVICGDWGYKTFNYFSTACEDQPKTYLATYAGPIFTFAMMYVGMYLLGREHKAARYLGFATIFAQLPAQRMISPFFKMNDEYYASAKLFGATPLVYWVVGLAILIICIPPLTKAYRSIENKHRLLWFLFYFLLFPYLLWGPIFGGLEYLMVNRGVLDETWIGIGWLFIINEIVTIILYFYTKPYLDPAYPKVE